MIDFAYIAAQIRAMIALLQEAKHLPGVQALLDVGSSILDTICGTIAAHPYICGGIVAVILIIIYLPEIINTIANWIVRLRLACKNLKKAWDSHISNLGNTFGC